MIRASKQYLCDEALPRVKAIFTGAEFWVSLGVGCLVGYWGESFVPANKSIDAIVGALLTYAAIAFGFCLAGLTLALTLPDRAFARKLAKSTVQQKKPDAYSDLLFVFSWTAVCHWVVILICLALFAINGPTQPIFPQDTTWVRRVAIGFVVAITVYGVLQFLITVLTLSQVGRAYIRSLQEEDSQTAPGKDKSK